MRGMKPRRHKGTKGKARRGFSFAEVMFAVIVLGIGFIMIAAIFPVAISQTQESLSDTAGVTVGRTGSIVIANLLSEGGVPAQAGPPAVAAIPAPYGDITSYADYSSTPPTLADGKVHAIDGIGTLTPSRWDRLKGNFVDTADPRFAWIPVGYKMSDESTGTFGPATSVARYAEIYVLAIQSQTKPIFDRTDFDPPATPGPAPFNSGIASAHPKLFTGVHIQDSTTGTFGIDTATFTGTDPFNGAIAPGAYILVSDDHLNTSPQPLNAKLMNGQYYRLGSLIAPNVYELQPGNDFSISPGRDGVLNTADDIKEIPAADVFLVGKGFDDNNNPTGFEGNAMDVFMLPPIIVQLPLQIP